MDPENTPPPDPQAPPSPDQGNPPPAAAVVASGTLPEDAAAELIRLRAEREHSGQTTRSLQTRIAELEDTVARLRTPPAPRVPSKSSWLEGATILG